MYTYTNLMAYYEDMVRKIRVKDALTNLETEIGRGTGHCLDVLEMSMDMNQPLNLKKSTEPYIPAIMLAAYQFYSKEKSPTECRTIIADKFGYYMLFETCNVFEEGGYKPEIILKGSSLVVSIRNEDGKELGIIDVFPVVQRFVKNNMKYDKVQKSMVISEPNALSADIAKQFLMGSMLL